MFEPRVQSAEAGRAAFDFDGAINAKQRDADILAGAVHAADLLRGECGLLQQGEYGPFGAASLISATAPAHGARRLT